MKKQAITLFASVILCVVSEAQQSSPLSIKSSLFRQDVFVENNGQFNNPQTSEIATPILYFTKKGKIKLFFSANTITFQQNDIVKDEDDETNDADAKLKTVPHYMSLTWEGANRNVKVEVQQPVSNYFTYSNPSTKSGMPSIVAHAWQKLIYHDIYKGIDLVFYYPEKGGVEYDVIVHPGADVSAFKMKYNGAQISMVDGNVVISSSVGTFIDHTPTAKDEDGNNITSLFAVHDNMVSFTTGFRNKNKTLIIDPWISNPNFIGSNKAYDLQYDAQGNVYVMGSGDNSEYELQKHNSTGAIQWTFSLNFTYSFKSDYYYGAFTTDKRSGTSYVAEGLDISGSGCLVKKINSSGSLVASFSGNSNINEIWRMAFDYCNNNVIIGAGDGGSPVYQAAILDTACVSMTPVNILGAGAGATHHDISMMALDGHGKCYFATAASASASYTGYNNIVLQVPVATLSPTAYQVFDRSAFTELASVSYYPALSSAPYLYSGNGYNGIVADAHLLVTYDGNKIRRWNPSTGSIIDSVTVNPNQQLSGGIDLDCSENIYVGSNASVIIYDSSLTLKNTYPLTDTVYDIKITNAGVLYACGKGFVSASAISTNGCSDSGCGALTSINENSAVSGSMILYPNPNNGKFSILLNNAELTHNNATKLSIYNALGEEIYSQTTLLYGQQSLDLSAQPNGIYFYRLTEQMGTLISSGKLIIQK